MGFPIGDAKFHDHIVTSVEMQGQHCAVTTDAGWTLGLSLEDMRAGGVYEIKPGDAFREYGDGIGRPVRGVFINGRKVYYRTEQEQQALFEEDQAEARVKRQSELDETRDDRDLRRGALPNPFRKRLDGFEERSPNWRRDHEPYELFTCEEAVKMAAALVTPEEVQAFHELRYEDQKARVPDLGEGHSGNTFGTAVRLAYWHLKEPESIPKMHAAICALVGCQEAGCWAGMAKEPIGQDSI